MYAGYGSEAGLIWYEGGFGVASCAVVYRYLYRTSVKCNAL